MNLSGPPVVKLLGIGLLALATLTAGGCATNPVTKKTELSIISEKQEIRLGKQEYLHTQQSAGGKFILDPALAAYVNEVGQKLVKVSDRLTWLAEAVLQVAAPCAAAGSGRSSVQSWR